MPTMDGFEATENIIKLCKYANCEVPYIVAFSANDPHSIEDKCKKVGMNEVMMKPPQDK